MCGLLLWLFPSFHQCARSCWRIGGIFFYVLKAILQNWGKGCILKRQNYLDFPEIFTLFSEKEKNNLEFYMILEVRWRECARFVPR